MHSDEERQDSEHRGKGHRKAFARQADGGLATSAACAKERARASGTHHEDGGAHECGRQVHGALQRGHHAKIGQLALGGGVDENVARLRERERENKVKRRVETRDATAMTTRNQCVRQQRERITNCIGTSRQRQARGSSTMQCKRGVGGVRVCKSPTHLDISVDAPRLVHDIQAPEGVQRHPCQHGLIHRAMLAQHL